jgi:rare lipoprotein A
MSACVVACLVLANCSASDKFARKLDPKYGVSASPRVVDLGEPVPKGGGTYRTGKPYVVAGRVYVPEQDPKNFREEGLASWYGDAFHGRRTANGEIFDMTSITAAHPTLPIPSYARVTNTRNGRSIIVRINDRGPFHGSRVIDLSVRTAKLLEFHDNGTARVRVEYVGTAPLEGSDDRQLVATLRTGTPAPAPSGIMLASAKPFIPEVPSSSRDAVRGEVPTPTGRPYTLGHTVQDASAVSATSEMSASRTLNSQAAQLSQPATPANDRFNYAHQATAGYDANGQVGTAQPVSAYAPAARGNIPGLASGRGLY